MTSSVALLNNVTLTIVDQIPNGFELWTYDFSDATFREKLIILSWLNLYIAEDYPLSTSLEFVDIDGILTLQYESDIPIAINKDDPVYKIYQNHIEDALNQNKLVVFSTDDLNLYNELPLWYINGTLMDLVDETIQGKITKKYYVLAEPGVEINAVQIRNDILQKAEKFIFPSNTNKRMLLTHGLVINKEINNLVPFVSIPIGFNPYQESFEQTFIFPNKNLTFCFLYLLALCPTWNFIREELIIRVVAAADANENSFIIRHSTIYLPDAVRVYIASKVNNLKQNPNDLEIKMTMEEPTFKNFIPFYDEENNVNVWLYQAMQSKGLRMPFLRIPPSIDLEDLSLTNRINIDYLED